MSYTFTMPLYTNRYMKVVVSINPNKEDPSFVKKVTGGRDESYTALVFSPRIYLKISTGKALTVPGAGYIRAAIPVNMIKVFNTLMSKVYKDTCSNDRMFVRDEYGILRCDNALCSTLSKSFSVFADRITISPGIVEDYQGKRDRGILIFTQDGQVGGANLYEAKDLIEQIELTDFNVISMLAAIMEQEFQNNEKLERVERKVDEILAALKGRDSLNERKPNPWGIGR